MVRDTKSPVSLHGEGERRERERERGREKERDGRREGGKGGRGRGRERERGGPIYVLYTSLLFCLCVYVVIPFFASSVWFSFLYLK